MRILNIRLGLATNSSSTHSLIFLPKGVVAEEITVDNQGYGWSNFQLTTPDSKLDYLSQSIYQHLLAMMGTDIAETVAKEWTGRPVDREGYVDHQSQLTFPCNWDGKGVDRGFFEDFKKYILREDVIIAGGNDNEDTALQAIEKGGIRKPEMNLLPRESSALFVARKDLSYWTLFNRYTGAKLRMSFEDSFKITDQRSSAPELVDIKITDYCPFNCEYCYQNSTPQGKHADSRWLRSLVYALQDLKVFEVALGGGEPTLHPEFLQILREFRGSNIVPNFTTKNLKWLQDPENAKEVLDVVGAVAVSCETAKDVKNLAIVKDKYYTHGYRPITVQHVVGVADEIEFENILLACVGHRFPVTLLGYKMVGRGPAFGTKPSAKWLSILKKVCEEHYLVVGIDTALANRYWDDLIAAGIREEFMTRSEGKYSCYVDAVDKLMYTSSYANTKGTSIPTGSFNNSIDPGDLVSVYKNLQ